jgi:hypothetical protein
MTNAHNVVEDISAVFDHYRVSARAIWNNAFWPDADLRDWDSVEQLGEIQRILFSELVLRNVAREWPAQDSASPGLTRFNGWSQ